MTLQPLFPDLLRILEKLLLTRVILDDSALVILVESILCLLLVLVCDVLLCELAGHLEVGAWTAVAAHYVMVCLLLLLVSRSRQIVFFRVAFIGCLAVASVVFVVDVCFGVLWLFLIGIVHDGDLLAELAANVLRLLTSPVVLAARDFCVDCLTVLLIFLRDDCALEKRALTLML